MRGRLYPGDHGLPRDSPGGTRLDVAAVEQRRKCRPRRRCAGALGRGRGRPEAPCPGVAHTCLTWGKATNIPEPPLILLESIKVLTSEVILRLKYM